MCIRTKIFGNCYELFWTSEVANKLFVCTFLSPAVVTSYGGIEFSYWLSCFIRIYLIIRGRGEQCGLESDVATKREIAFLSRFYRYIFRI